MQMSNWKKEVMTIPNFLSIFRLSMIPVYMHLFLNAKSSYQYFIAGVILTISCLTDALDGIIARRFHMISTLGKILDPLADKLTQFALMVSLSVRYSSLSFVLLLFLFKEIFQLTLGIINLQHHKILPGALPEGKICTAVLFSSLIFLVFFPQIHPGVVTAIAWMNAFFLTVSFISYFLAYFGKNPQVQDFFLE